MGKFLIFFVIMTIAEVFIMKEVAERIGYMNLLFMVLFTGFLGISLAKQQGREHLTVFQQEMASGKMPAHPILQGLMILVAAAVLITPGFITDILGFSLLFPPVRKLLAPFIAKMVKGKVTQQSNFTFYSNMNMGGEPSGFQQPNQNRTYDNDTFDMPKDRDDDKLE